MYKRRIVKVVIEIKGNFHRVHFNNSVTEWHKINWEFMLSAINFLEDDKVFIRVTK